jgi:RNA polymerase sigma factor (sigma-70 family)
MEPSDEALVLACRRGDASAWEALVWRYQRLVYAIPRRAGLDQEQSADVCQRTFAVLVEKIDQLEQPARIGAWLATVAKRETWRISRREQTAGTTQYLSPEGQLAEEALADALLPEEELVRLEEQHTVRLALAQLEERCRRLLTLLFYRSDAPPYAEVAAALGVSAGHIGPTRARCLQKLRHILDAVGF